MEPQFNTSFIPKESLKVTNKPSVEELKKRRSRVYGLGFTLTSLVALIMLIATAGVFFYGITIRDSINQKQNLLSEAYAQLDDQLIVELREFDERLRIAEELTDSHIAFSHFFTILEEHTLRRGLRYKTMSFSFSKEGSPQVLLSGEAVLLSNVALQLDAFRTSGIFNAVVLNNVQRAGEDGSLATFSLTLTLPKKYISFIDTASIQKENKESVETNSLPIVPRLESENPPLLNTGESEGNSQGEGGEGASTQEEQNTPPNIAPNVPLIPNQ